MSGLSPTEILVRWARDAAPSAASGVVCDENLRALVGPTLDRARSWEIARDGYVAMLRELEPAEVDLAVKLIVPLLPTDDVTLAPPSASELQMQIDPQIPPAFVLHQLMPRRDWEPVEEYRRPLSTGAFLGGDGTPAAECLYIVFRTAWEVEEGAPYRRELLYERVLSRGG